ncbi:MAG: hypothetical protein JEY96_01440 [Bacteroidales bacterium]|nr:hypothetical protein [Bacteroidales bacterium]
MSLSSPITPPLVALTGNDMRFSIETTDSAQDLYGLFLQVQKSNREATEVWSDVGPELRAPADVNNQATFKIQDILQETETSPIKSPSIGYIVESDLTIKYRVKYYEKYGSAQTTYNITYSGLFYALQGGIGHITEKKYEALNSSWYDQIKARHGFLSNMPFRKVTNAIIGDAYLEKLWYYNYNGLRTLTLKVKTYYSDKAPIIIDVSSISNANQHYLYEIEASYRKLGVNETNAIAYDVWIENSGTPASEIRHYSIINGYTRRLKYFVYLNNYNMPENLIFTGEYDGKANYTKGESVSLETKESSEENIREDIEREASTGLIKREWILHLREFYGAKKKYEYLYSEQTNSFLLVPIIFESKKLPEPGSEDLLFNHNIKYRFAFTAAFNDNILFLSNAATALKLKEIVKPTPGANNVSVNMEDAEAEFKVHGKCYAGGGVIYIKQSSDNEIALTINFEDCTLVYNEAEDYTTISFIMGHWILAAYNSYYIELSHNIFQNKDALHMEAITTNWNFSTVD